MLAMKPLSFINYRRADSQQAAIGLYIQLRTRIGPPSVFMDRSGISAGDIWSQRLRDAMDAATVVLALIGPNWLTSADEYGRRRLDIANDWVRTELLAAIEKGKIIIPVLLGAQSQVPPAAALPECLMAVLDHQAYGLRDDHWDSDLDQLVRLLTGRYGFKDAERTVVLPNPIVTISPLNEAELDSELKALPGWEPVESIIPGDYPRSRQELRKVYVFQSFKAAIAFMSAAVSFINQLKHHPRWENQWRTVTVYLSTWDIGHRISKLDVELARRLDQAYEK
jgi:pterin-4a-carbinolamine dehydratase